MALIKTSEEREIAMLQKVEHELERRERRERRERIHHILIAGLGLLSIAAFVGGHLSGRKCIKKHRLL